MLGVMSMTGSGWFSLMRSGVGMTLPPQQSTAASSSRLQPAM